MHALFFLQPGTNSRRIFLDFIAQAAAWGMGCSVFDLSPYFAAPITRDSSQAFTYDVQRLLASLAPDVTFSMWSNVLSMLTHESDGAGNVKTVFDRHNIPHYCFWLDAPHWAQNRSLLPLFPCPVFRTPTTHHIINNSATAEEMSRVLGMGNVSVMAHGVHDGTFNNPRESKQTPYFDSVVSLGPGDPAPTPAAIAQLPSDDPDIHAVRESGAVAVRPKLIKLGITAGFVQSDWEKLIDDAIKQQLDYPYIPMLDRLCSLTQHNTIVQGLLRSPALYINTTALLRAADSMMRAFTISWLSQRFNIATFGSGNLAAIGWPCRATSLGDVPYESMAACYHLGATAINVMRWQDDVGLNIKPYEATASGVALLSAKRPQFAEAFVPQQEAMEFSSPQELAVQLTNLLAHPADREYLAAAGKKRTLTTHLWQHRLQRLGLNSMRTAAA